MMQLSNPRLTVKQIQILQTIHRHWQAHREEIDVDQLLEELPYRTTKESMQFSIRALIKKGVILRCEFTVRRGRQRRVLKITDHGKQMLGIRSETS